MSVIRVNSVVKRFGSFVAVDSVSFEAKSSRIFGLLGPNGAGKTSTIRMLNNITAPDEGKIFIKDKPVSENSQEWIGYLPEERGLYKKMKVGEQLHYLAQLKGLSSKQAKTSIAYWLDRFEASSWVNKEITDLSKGMQQKIQFIATVSHDPDICIFDEPFTGLDPINSELLKNVILELKEKGKTILFATHRMEQVEQMCDDICLFNNGKVILSGELSTIKKSFGKNTVNIEFKGDGSFLNELENVRINNKSNNFAEIRLLDGADSQKVLKKAIEHVEIISFELVQPTLNEIFISTVNSDNSKI